MKEDELIKAAEKLAKELIEQNDDEVFSVGIGLLPEAHEYNFLWSVFKQKDNRAGNLSALSQVFAKFLLRGLTNIEPDSPKFFVASMLASIIIEEALVKVVVTLPAWASADEIEVSKYPWKEIVL